MKKELTINQKGNILGRKERCIHQSSIWDQNIYTLLMKRSTSRGKTPCSHLKVNWCFRGPCRLHPQGSKDKPSKRRWQTDSNCLLAWIILLSQRWQHTSSKHDLICNGMHGLILQETDFSVDDAVRTSSPSVLDCMLHNTFCPESLSCWKTCSFLVYSRMLFDSRAMRAAHRLASLLRLTTADACSAVTLSTVSLSHGSNSYWMCCLSTG
jgi:hypothetical protein